MAKKIIASISGITSFFLMFALGQEFGVSVPFLSLSYIEPAHCSLLSP